LSDDNSALLRAKAYDQPSVLQPANLLREGRRQRGRPDVAVPAVCLLDPDGDIVRHLTATGQATEHPGWACYHTTLWTFDLDGQSTGLTQPVVTGATWTTDAPYRDRGSDRSRRIARDRGGRDGSRRALRLRHGPRARRDLCRARHQHHGNRR
jgi:hypothetical protein